MHNSLFGDSASIWVGASKPMPVTDKGYLFYQTSGSSSDSKWIAYKKDKFLKAAESANQFLQVTKNDIWLDILPSSHVASLSVKARSHSAGFEVIEYKEKWSPDNFLELSKKATVSSLVPTQIYDLVKKQIKAPKNLRFILVGGGALGVELYMKARQLGWPVLPTYGLSEAGSQVATAPLKSLSEAVFPALDFLGHIKPDINAEGYLGLTSDYLFEGYYDIDSNSILKRETVFLTSDKASIKNGQLISIKRDSFSKKVLGVLVDKEKAESLLLKKCESLSGQIVVLFIKDDRSENKLIVVSEHKNFSELSIGVSSYNLEVDGPHRISKIYHLSKIPRSELGKPQIPKIIEALGLL